MSSGFDMIGMVGPEHKHPIVPCAAPALVAGVNAGQVNSNSGNVTCPSMRMEATTNRCFECPWVTDYWGPVTRCVAKVMRPANAADNCTLVAFGSRRSCVPQGKHQVVRLFASLRDPPWRQLGQTTVYDPYPVGVAEARRTLFWPKGSKFLGQHAPLLANLWRAQQRETGRGVLGDDGGDGANSDGGTDDAGSDGGGGDDDTGADDTGADDTGADDSGAGEGGLPAATSQHASTPGHDDPPTRPALSEEERLIEEEAAETVKRALAGADLAGFVSTCRSVARGCARVSRSDW